MTFEEWLDHRLRSLLRLATVLCGSPELAEDLVHDVLIKCQQRWDHLQAMQQRDAYVRRMLVNEHLSFRRKFGRMVLGASVSDEPPRLDDAPGFDQQYADRVAIRQELDRLPPRQRAVLVLRFYDGLDDPAIAAVLGCRPATVRSYAARALASLRITHADSREDSRAH